jgi:hypothetical protein
VSDVSAVRETKFATRSALANELVSYNSVSGSYEIEPIYTTQSCVGSNHNFKNYVEEDRRNYNDKCISGG